jgi:hypothetical protein
LNKKQEALRRGLRSFIEDTSRELADLEGRDIVPAEGTASEASQTLAPPAVKPPETPQVLPDRARPDPTPPSSVDAPTETRGAPVAPPTISALVDDPPQPGPAPAAETAEIAPPPAGEVLHPILQPVKPRRRPRGPARRRLRPRAGDEIGSNGVRAEQVHARKGVCFAYFLNHECWRIPEAYCNGALQVCITRECPVYHLHKEALERRFARKFKHFW